MTLYELAFSCWVFGHALEEQGVHVPTRTRRIRGKLNVPRERFWTTPDGNYRTVEVP